MADSIITSVTEYCIMCCKPTTDIHHLCFGRSERRLADEDGLTIPVCRECHSMIHNDARLGHLSKILGQIAWEGKYGDRQDFIRRYGKSWC